MMSGGLKYLVADVFYRDEQTLPVFTRFIGCYENLQRHFEQGNHVSEVDSHSDRRFIQQRSQNHNINDSYRPNET